VEDSQCRLYKCGLSCAGVTVILPGNHNANGGNGGTGTNGGTGGNGGNGGTSPPNTINGGNGGNGVNANGPGTGVLQVTLVSVVHLAVDPFSVLHPRRRTRPIKAKAAANTNPLFLFFRHPQLSEQNRHVRTSLDTKFY
jgi:hypothetical protein